MNFLKLFLPLLLTGNLGFSEAPNAGEVSIDSISVAGSGCNNQSVGSYISDDGKAMSVIFDDFIVDSTRSESSKVQKSCNINLGMKVPAGWSYSLFCLEVVGYGSLDKGIVGTQEAHYSFDSGRKNQMGTLNLTGPFDSDYSKLFVLPINTLSWSPCSTGDVKPLVLDTDISVTKPQPIAFDKRKVRMHSRKISARSSAIYGKTIRILGRKHSVTKSVLGLRDGMNELARANDRRKPLSELQAIYKKLKPSFNAIVTEAKNNPKYGNDSLIKKRLDNIKGHEWQLKAFIFPLAGDGEGLMTIDSVDGTLKHHYGISWKKCSGTNPVLSKGQWVKTYRQDCSKVCKSKGLSLGVSPDGASCTSGEVRPFSAVGKVDYVKGCWGGCGAQQNVLGAASRGGYCYLPSQKKDADRTDRTVGCFCE